MIDRKSTRLNSSHSSIYTLSLHDALPIFSIIAAILSRPEVGGRQFGFEVGRTPDLGNSPVHHDRSEEHTSELQSQFHLHSLPTRRSSDLLDHRGNPLTPRGRRSTVRLRGRPDARPWQFARAP